MPPTARALSPGELSQALEVYRSTGTYRGAALAIGRDESTVRKALRRHHAPDRARLMGEELQAAHANALRVVGRARRKVRDALDLAVEPRDVAVLAAAAHDGLRAVTTALVAHARLVATTPPVVPAKHDLSVLSDEELMELERITAKLEATRPRDLSTMTDEELHAELERLEGRVLDRVAVKRGL